MLIPLLILIAMKYTIYHWEQFDNHFPMQVQSCKSIWLFMRY